MLIVLIVLVVIMFAIISLYNNLITQKNRVDNAWSQIDVQLQRRFDLIPNLVETVKGYASHEKEVLEELGDPRLLAKTIIDMAGEDAGGYVEESEGHTSGRAFSGKTYRIPLWVGLIILLLIIIVVFKIVGLVLGALLPIVLPILLIYWLVKYFRRN